MCQSFLYALVFSYVPQSSIGLKAPTCDFEAIQDMHKFSEFDSDIGMEVYAGLKRHCWYLTEKLAIMAIVDGMLTKESE